MKRIVTPARALLPVLIALALCGPAPAQSPVRIQGATGNTATVSAGGALTVGDGSGALNVIVDSGAITATVTDGSGALNTIVDSGTITAVTTVTNPVTVTDGSGALNVIVDSGSITVSDGAGALNTIIDSGTVTTITNPVTVTDGSGALNVIVDSGAITATVTDGAGALNTIIDSGTVTAVTTITNPVTVTDGSGSLNVIVDSGSITVSDGAGALNTIIDSGTVTTVSTVTTVTNAVGIKGADGSAIAGNSNPVPVSDAGSSITVDNGGTFAVQPGAATSGGLTPYQLTVAASDNHANVKTSAGQVYQMSAFSIHTAALYVRLYDAGSGFNGCNSSTNLKYSAIIPGASTGAGFAETWPTGLSFSSGIAICVTGAIGDTDTTNATASVARVNIGYK